MNRILLSIFALAPLAGCPSSADPDRVDAILALDGDAANGALVYGEECAVCHGGTGEGGSGPSMDRVAGESGSEIVSTVLSGEESMPSFEDLLDEDIADLLAWIRETW